jgi:hypothetical protein
MIKSRRLPFFGDHLRDQLEKQLQLSREESTASPSTQAIGTAGMSQS